MAEKNNATCAICGKPYHMCLSCKDKIASAPWKRHTDTSEHYKIYQVIHGMSVGVYSKTEAKKRLQNVDLSDINSLRDNIKTIIEDIMAEPKVVEPAVHVMVEPEPIVEEPPANIVEPVVRRKKKHETFAKCE